MTALAIGERYAARARLCGWSPERDALVINLYMQGKSNAEIASEASMSTHTLAAMLERMKLRRVIPRFRPARRG